MAKNYKEKICEVCGKVFIPTSSNQKTCSSECKKIKYKEYKKEYNKQWRERNEDYHKQWYEQNKEYRKDYHKQWRKRNEEYRKEYYKQWREQNKEQNKEYQKQWRKQNREYQKQWRERNEDYHKQWYEQNKEHSKEYSKQWRKQNEERYKEYRRTKYNTDLQYKLADWSRRQVKRCLNSNKTEHTFDILDYTPEQLKQRLEMNFKPDMTWENHGTLWHIDHRKPLCKFNFTLSDGTPNYEQIRLANSLANLQPLYVTENLSKGGK